MFLSRSKKAGLALTVSLLGLTALPAVSHAAGDHQITMQQADIRAFIDDVSIVTGRTFLVDPRVQGKVTISSEQSLSPSEVFTVFKDVLRVHGYTLIRTAGGEYRVTLLQGAAQDAPFVENSGYAGTLATTVIQLDNTDASVAAKMIKPVLHSQGILTATPGGTVLVVTDFPENLKKAREIIKALDKDERAIETVRLTNLTALDAEAALKTLAGAKPKYKVVAMPGSNSLILEGDAAEIARIRPILLQMDSGGASARGAVSVLPLRFADGASLIEVLETLLPAYAREGQPAPTVAYEAGSNAMIISATGETQQALEQIIRRLDVRRPQVLVEAIIVEISDGAAQDLGLQFALGGVDGSSVPFIGTNFSRQAPNILSLAGALATSEGSSSTTVTNATTGISTTTTTADTALQTAAVNALLGLEGGIIGGAGRSGDTLFSVILNAVASDDNSNVLSTPFVTTLDNVPARFIVGQNIPITSGESLGSNNANPFRTFDREDVGIKLNVTPQISEGDVIRLQITQEVSSISGALSSVSSDFVINTREIETTVLADDGEVIVLGGLIEEIDEFEVEKVPLLGDAPVIGRLFRSEGESKARTNLMVFLRPTIIRTRGDATVLTQKRLEQIRAIDRAQTGDEISKYDRIIGQ